ncbi:MAG: hypothetical protein JXQ69_09385 [Paludibacteraceae bacterium]|nr:hypothetical protein [Paludibacteraceae bacterium]
MLPIVTNLLKFMFQLQPYKGKSTRHTCPACGHKMCFTLYINTDTNQPIHLKVGICNRAIKCGYHYTPKQYFADNRNLTNNDYQNKTPYIKPFQPLHKIDFITELYVKKSLSQNSNFVSFLYSKFKPEQVQRALFAYKLGATKNNEVIFWQIDTLNRVRTGKIMQYNPLTGKRIKHQSGAIDWVHNKLKQSKLLNYNFNLKQCFFGEHLLNSDKNKWIGIVESEKTAIIASLNFPNLIWLATGSLNNLTIERCTVLTNRNIILYPDLGASLLWESKAINIQSKTNCTIKVSKLLNQIATINEKENGCDIGDYILL